MKKIFVLSALLLSSWSVAHAHSTALTCTEIGIGPDDGYRVHVLKGRKEAKVEEVTIVGARTIALLHCKEVEAKPPAADIEYPVLSCNEPVIRDDGYSLEVRQGGFTELTYAELFNETLLGARHLADMTCVEENEE